MNQKAHGFTIVELLIVIVLIALLAAISIVAYRGIQDRANLSSASATATQIARKILLYYTEHGTYPVSLTDAGIDASSASAIQYSYNNTSTPKTYCITTTTNTKSTYLNNTTATTPTPGGCPGHGQGGSVAVVNMASDPAATGSVLGEYQSRWSMARSFVSGASDGPQEGLSTYARFTIVSAVTGSSRGIDHWGNSDNSQPWTGSTAWPVTANVPVTVSVWTRSTVSNSALRMAFRVHNGTGAWVAPQVLSTAQDYVANGWVRVVRTYTPPVDGYLAAGTWYGATSTYPTGSTIDYTGLMVTTGSAISGYADGNSPNWIWNGTPNSSTSTGPLL